MFTQASNRLKVGFSLLFLFVVFATVKGQIKSDFAYGSDGLTAFDNNSGLSSAVTYTSTGGNPNGYISFTTTANYVPIYFRAPAKFQGNLSIAYNKNLSFDLKVSTAGTDNSNGDV